MASKNKMEGTRFLTHNKYKLGKASYSLVHSSPIILVPYLDIFPLISQSDIVSISELIDTENYQSVR